MKPVLLTVSFIWSAFFPICSLATNVSTLPPPQAYEIDMLGVEFIRTRVDADKQMQTGIAKLSVSARWKNGIVFYKIDDSLNCTQRCIVYEAMKEIEQKTCLSFVEDKRQTNKVVRISLSTICAAHVGVQDENKPQELYLNDHCFTKLGYPIHELMHVIGFFHEHVRSDQSDYVQIHHDNIDSSYHHMFTSHNLGPSTTLDLPYDYDSVMHFEPLAFSKNGKETITVKNKPNHKVGQRNHLSPLDVQKINKYYNCSHAVGSIGCTDKYETCKQVRGYERRCEMNYKTKEMCPKTCNRCDKVSEHVATCTDPIQRCRALTGDMFRCSDKLKREMHKTCYLSCSNCD